MDELIILLVRGLVRLFGGPPQNRSTNSGNTPREMPAVKLAPQWEQQLRQITAPPKWRGRFATQKKAPPKLSPRSTQPEAVVSVVSDAVKIFPKTAAVATQIPTGPAVPRLSLSTLRKAIVLSEILAPPVALRDER